MHAAAVTKALPLGPAAVDDLDFGAQAAATMLTHAITMSTALRMCIPLDCEPAKRSSGRPYRPGSHRKVRVAITTAPTIQTAITMTSDQWNGSPR
jgi:hypothetical protein